VVNIEDDLSVMDTAMHNNNNSSSSSSTNEAAKINNDSSSNGKVPVAPDMPHMLISSQS
jgi:hypothetical protein